MTEAGFGKSGILTANTSSPALPWCGCPSKIFGATSTTCQDHALTKTDVEQRLRAVQDERHGWLDEELKSGCFALYEREKAEGTEYPAILGALEQFVELEEERLRIKREAAYRDAAEAARVALEQRFLAGADCKWTPVNRSKAVYCRMNGRTFRLSPRNDKKWDLNRIDSIEDKGRWIGTYLLRGEATKIIAKIAYQDEPRW